MKVKIKTTLLESNKKKKARQNCDFVDYTKSCVFTYFQQFQSYFIAPAGHSYNPYLT